MDLGFSVSWDITYNTARQRQRKDVGAQVRKLIPKP